MVPPIQYCNPVIDGYFADPFVFEFENTYYAVGTSTSKQGLFPMRRSENLRDWTETGPSLVRPQAVEGTDFWAPEIAFEGGMFYMYYSVGFKDVGHRLRVATSSNPAGPYVDLDIDLVDPAAIMFAIDPSPFRDEDGQWYLFYARDFLTSQGDERPGTALVMDRLVNMTRLAGEERVVLRATQDWQQFMKGRAMYGGTYDWHTLEGPCVVRHDDRYYCFYSAGRWENETYGVDYAEAENLRGPWKGSADAAQSPRVLRSIPGEVIGPGHNSVVKGPDGRTDYIVYHAWDPAMSARRMCIDKLLWTAEGPRCLGPTTTPQTL